MDINNIKQVYLIGIGGIGMSGLARYFKRRGCAVAGYDRVKTTLTEELEREGMTIAYTDDEQEVPGTIRRQEGNSQQSTLIIFTPAIPKNSTILNWFRNSGYELKKRSEVLGLISKNMFTIAVAGTHGKTTTGTMIAHILKHSGYDCSAFLGGIASNYQSNVLFGNNNTVVVEADEFDRSFLALYPDIAVITSMDADHLDIYGDKNHLEDSFRQFASQVKAGGTLIKKQGLPLSADAVAYGLGEGEAVGQNIRIEQGQYFFDYLSTGHHIKNIALGLPGMHNVENAVAAVTVALQLKISGEKIKEALAAFKGVKRRFEYIVKSEEKIFIDDYAHHPEELRACINSVRQLYPTKKLTAVFQPHLYTRTRDFADGFAEALGLVDELILLPVYPARELPIEGVNAEMILGKVKLAAKKICEKKELIEEVRSRKIEVLLTVGAGDIDQMVEPLRKAIVNG